MVRKIKKLGIAVMAVLILTTGTAQAQTSFPGCSQGYYDVLYNHGRAMMTQARGQMSKLIPPSDSTLALTCFDQAAVNASKAGFIFSDVAVAATAVPVFNAVIGTGLGAYNPGRFAGYPGSTSFLVEHFYNAIEGMFSNYRINFQNTRFAALAGIVIHSLIGSDNGLYLMVDLASTAAAVPMAPGYPSARTMVLSNNFDCDLPGETWYDRPSAPAVARPVTGFGLESDYDYLYYREMVNYATAGPYEAMANARAADSAGMSQALADWNSMNANASTAGIVGLSNIDPPGSGSSVTALINGM